MFRSIHWLLILSVSLQNTMGFAQVGEASLFGAFGELAHSPLYMRSKTVKTEDEKGNKVERTYTWNDKKDFLTDYRVLFSSYLESRKVVSTQALRCLEIEILKRDSSFQTKYLNNKNHAQIDNEAKFCSSWFDGAGKNPLMGLSVLAMFKEYLQLRFDAIKAKFSNCSLEPTFDEFQRVRNIQPCGEPKHLYGKFENPFTTYNELKKPNLPNLTPQERQKLNKVSQDFFVAQRTAFFEKDLKVQFLVSQNPQDSILKNLYLRQLNSQKEKTKFELFDYEKVYLEKMWDKDRSKLGQHFKKNYSYLQPLIQKNERDLSENFRKKGLEAYNSRINKYPILALWDVDLDLVKSYYAGQLDKRRLYLSAYHAIEKIYSLQTQTIGDMKSLDIQKDYLKVISLMEYDGFVTYYTTQINSARLGISKVVAQDYQTLVKWKLGLEVAGGLAIGSICGLLNFTAVGRGATIIALGLSAVALCGIGINAAINIYYLKVSERDMRNQFIRYFSTTGFGAEGSSVVLKEIGGLNSTQVSLLISILTLPVGVVSVTAIKSVLAKLTISQKTKELILRTIERERNNVP